MCKSSLENRVRSDKHNRAQNAIIMANKLRKRFGNTYPVPIVEVTKSLGFKLFSSNLPRNVDGFVFVSPDIRYTLGTDKIIAVNCRLNAKRRRFIVAHELAHYLLDFAETKAEFCDVFKKGEVFNNKKEEIVNMFAIMLLISEGEFEKRYDEYKNKYTYYETAKRLSDDFLVPVKIIDYKIKNAAKEV